MTKALVIERIATTYGQPPHVVATWDADFYLRHLQIVKEAKEGNDG